MRIEITRQELTAAELRAAAAAKNSRAARRTLAIAPCWKGRIGRLLRRLAGWTGRFCGEADQETFRGTVSPPNARVGQQGTLTRIWARRGTRPRAMPDTRSQWALARSLELVAFSGSLFGAVCPARGVAAGLVLPTVNTEAMSAHLAEISRTIAPVRRGNDPPDHFLILLTPWRAYLGWSRLAWRNRPRHSGKPLAADTAAL